VGQDHFLDFRRIAMRATVPRIVFCGFLDRRTVRRT
jgi:hypothetical protein